MHTYVRRCIEFCHGAHVGLISGAGVYTVVDIEKYTFCFWTRCRLESCMDCWTISLHCLWRPDRNRHRRFTHRICSYHTHTIMYNSNILYKDDFCISFRPLSPLHTEVFVYGYSFHIYTSKAVCVWTDSFDILQIKWHIPTKGQTNIRNQSWIFIASSK